MSLPITIRCECGHVTEAQSGDEVTCVCGRRYDTSELPSSQLAVARAVETRARYYARFGFTLVIGITLIAFFFRGWLWAGLALPATCIIWFKFIQPGARRRAARAVAQLPTWTVEAEE